MLPATSENLALIRVLFRAPDTLHLYGIPYEMRADVNQSPRDLWNAPHADRPPRYGWVALGLCVGPQPEPIASWLATIPHDAIPMGPYEWTSLASFEACPDCGAVGRAHRTCDVCLQAADE